jgi:uncharacterized protein (DUF1778 family)
MFMDKEKRNARQARYMKNKERINFVMTPETKKEVNAAAASAGISAAEFIRQAIEEKLIREKASPEITREPLDNIC